jgi:hypothetical protein
MNKSPWHMPSKKRMMDKFPIKDDGWKKRELAKHKNIQK